MKTNFEIWRDSDNVIKTAENGYKTQCTQYKKEFTHDELKAYFIREYAENSKEYADEIADLFEHYEELPQEVQDLILTITEEFDYKDCENMVLSLNELGYTCEYGLSAELFNLQKIGTSNKTPEEMNTTEKHVYTTVLKSISIHTIVFKKAFEMCQKFDEEIKYKGINTDEYWQAQAYRDFINLLEEEAKKIKSLQNETLNKLTFLIK